MADAVGLRVANVFHAGDGNLHPLVLFDDAVEGQAHDAEELAGSILELCIASGGSITGEHGVGQEKRHKMAKQFTPEDLDTMQLVRCAFDPDGIANPGKVFPTPAAVRRAARPAHGRARAVGRRARRGLLMTTMTTARRPGGPDDAVGGVVPREVVRPTSVEEVAEVLRGRARPTGAASSRSAAAPRRPGRRRRPPATCCSTPPALDRIVEHVAGDLVVVAEAGVRLADLQSSLGEHGQLLGLDPPEQGATLGGVVSANASGPRRLAYGTVRDLLIGTTVVLADGTVAKAGGKVVKNVAGYDLGKLYTGAHGTLGVVVSTTWRLHPLPPARRVVIVDLADSAAGRSAGDRAQPLDADAVGRRARRHRRRPGAARRRVRVDRRVGDGAGRRRPRAARRRRARPTTCPRASAPRPGGPADVVLRLAHVPDRRCRRPSPPCRAGRRVSCVRGDGRDLRGARPPTLAAVGAARACARRCARSTARAVVLRAPDGVRGRARPLGPGR